MRSVVVYGSEAFVSKGDDMMALVVVPEFRISAEELENKLKPNNIKEWFDHLEKMEKSAWPSK